MAGLPKLLSGPLGDIREIARGMQTLPELVRILEQIRISAASMDDEVKRMRQAVDSLNVEVGNLPERLDEIQDSVPFSRKRKR